MLQMNLHIFHIYFPHWFKKSFYDQHVITQEIPGLYELKHQILYVSDGHPQYMVYILIMYILRPDNKFFNKISMNLFLNALCASAYL